MNEVAVAAFPSPTDEPGPLKPGNEFLQLRRHEFTSGYCAAEPPRYQDGPGLGVATGDVNPCSPQSHRTCSSRRLRHHFQTLGGLKIETLVGWRRNVATTHCLRQLVRRTELPLPTLEACSRGSATNTLAAAGTDSQCPENERPGLKSRPYENRPNLKVRPHDRSVERHRLAADLLELRFERRQFLHQIRIAVVGVLADLLIRLRDHALHVAQLIDQHALRVDAGRGCHLRVELA